ncbi:hypothetical protein [Vibrio phage CKB-S2]|nr:hypothetical protein [Vibrio phage CKB-S2]
MTKSMFHLLLTLFLSVFFAFMNATKALASEEETTAVFVGGWSYHFDQEYDYNESHAMFAFQYDKVVAGTFINSYSDRGYLLGYDSWKIENEYGAIGTYITLMTGYENFRVLPMILPYAQLNAFEVNDIEIKPTVLLWGKAVALTINVEF